MAHENFVSARLRKAWKMKPKAKAGNSTTKPGGKSSPAKLKERKQKPKKEKNDDE